MNAWNSNSSNNITSSRSYMQPCLQKTLAAPLRRRPQPHASIATRPRRLYGVEIPMEMCCATLVVYSIAFMA